MRYSFYSSRSLIFALATLTLSLLFFSTTLSAQADLKNELLWEITGNGLESPSYLYGTMHLRDSRVFELGDSVLLAIASCDKFALEVHPDELMGSMFDILEDASEEDVLKDLLSEEEYQKLSERFLEINGYSLETVPNKNPMLLQFSLQPDFEREGDYATFLDGHLYGIARTLKKEILGLEDVDLHMRYFESANSEEQRQMILDILKYTQKENLDELNRWVEIYKEGDLKGIENLMGSSLNDSIMVLRNQQMVRTISNEIGEESLFSAMGAAHLMGDQGVVSLLQNEGYDLRPVQYVYNNLLAQYPVEPEKFETKPFVVEEFGYQYDSPGEMIQYSIMEQFELNMYVELSSNNVLTSMAMDLRAAPLTQDVDTLLNRMVKGMVSDKMEVLNQELIDWKGERGVAITYQEGEWLTESKIVYREGLVYLLAVVYPENHYREKFAQRFFDSVEFLELPEVAPTHWQAFTHNEGALEIQVPGEMTYIKREVPMEVLGEEETVAAVFNIYYCTDLIKGANYFVTYNDFPPGYTLASADVYYQSIVDEYKATGIELVSEFENFEDNGLKGRTADLLLPGNHYCKLRVYIRGNRAYRIFKQNLTPNEMSLPEDSFFSSFEYLPFEEVTSSRYTYDEAGFSTTILGEYITEAYTDPMELPYYSDLHFVSSTNPKSGATHFTEVSTLSPYFKIENLDSFYLDLSESLVSWSDSLLTTSFEEFAGQPGIRLTYCNKEVDLYGELRLALIGDKMVSQYIYGAREEMESPTVKDFFKSLKLEVPPGSYDYYSSKMDLLIKDLYGEDPSNQEYAKNALLYYEVREDEIEQVMTAIQKPLADDSLNNSSTRVDLLIGITSFLKGKEIEELRALYKKPETQDPLKSQILYSTTQGETELGIATFFELFVSDPPQEPYYTYAHLQEFRDSMEMVKKHLPFLISLTANDEYQMGVMNLLNDYAKTGKEHEGHLRKFNKEIFTGTQEKLNAAIADSEGKSLPWDLGVSENLDLMKTVKGLEITETYTSTILSQLELPPYIRNEAIVTRLENDLGVNKSWLKASLDSVYTRYPIITALQNVDKLKKVPKKYLKEENLIENFLTYQLHLEDDYPDRFNLLGELVHVDSTYFAYEVIYDYNETAESYLVLVGPVPPQSPAFDFEQLEYFTYWSNTEDNWREQAKGILEEVK